MEEKIKKQNIQKLNINNNTIKILNENNIHTISQLCKKSKKDLRNLGIISNQINKAEIELELLGLNLKNSL